MVFGTSAFWHGFYPFYYVCFTLALIGAQSHKWVYIGWYIFKPIPRNIRMAICTVVTYFTVNSVAVL